MAKLSLNSGLPRFKLVSFKAEATVRSMHCLRWNAMCSAYQVPNGCGPVSNVRTMGAGSLLSTLSTQPSACLALPT